MKEEILDANTFLQISSDFTLIGYHNLLIPKTSWYSLVREIQPLTLQRQLVHLDLAYQIPRQYFQTIQKGKTGFTN